jgi:hypothetical protein
VPMDLGMKPQSFFLAVFLVLAAACSSSSGPSLTPARTNCSNVCEKAHDCLNPSMDVARCTDDCDRNSSDAVYEAKVGECANCVEPKACTETASCTGDCLQIYLP